MTLVKRALFRCANFFGHRPQSTHRLVNVGQFPKLHFYDIGEVDLHLSSNVYTVV